MRLTLFNGLILATYFLISFLIAWRYRHRAQQSLSEFFVSGRGAPWWLAGTSMVATTFAADTPLAVTGLTVRYGIAGNWLWWSLLLSGMLTVFFYARLWRRAGVLTDVEFVELRYAGRPATFLRAFRAVYLGVVMNCLILGWVNLAMVKVLTLMLGLSKIEAVLACLLVTGLYTTLSGLWGVLLTDIFQFALMMTMTILLAFFAVDAVGGLAMLRTKLLALEAARTDAAGDSLLAFVPSADSAWMPLLVFLVYLGVNWWASWYPGAEPGGGGYVAQRIFSAKDEKHSLWATLWFNVAHYALRPWPWILVALASAVLYPGLGDPEAGYVRMMAEHLPANLRALMLAAFLAAYMSTVSTHLNWGSSYVVNDFYRRLLRRTASERHYIRAAQLATLGLMVVAAVVTYFLHSIEQAWRLLLMVGAGTGAVYLLRWYWWRINAWSEIAAMVAAFGVSVWLQQARVFAGSEQVVFAKTMLLTTAVTTAVWLAATWLARPTPREHLVEFYRRTRPTGPGWGPIAALAPEVSVARSGWGNLRAWLFGSVLVYAALFGIGKLLLVGWVEGTFYLALSALAAVALYADFRRRGWESFG